MEKIKKEKRKNSEKKCKVIGIVSFKGGVGKTSCTANLACALAKLNKKVLAVDSNFSSPNLGLNFGLLSPLVTLKDAITEKAGIEEAIHIHDSNVHIIPGSPFYEKFEAGRLRQEINKLKSLYEFVLLDCSPSLNHELVASLIACDELFIVSTSDYPTLIATMRAAKIAKDKKVNVKGIILNRIRGKKFELSKEEVEETTGLPVISILPEDEKVIESSANLIPLLVLSPYRKVSREYKKLAAVISGERYVPETLFTRMRDFIVDKYDIQAKEFIRGKF